MENIAIDYDVANSTLCDAIHWTEDTLVKSGLFALPSKRSLGTSRNVLPCDFLLSREFTIFNIDLWFPNRSTCHAKEFGA